MAGQRPGDFRKQVAVMEPVQQIQIDADSAPEAACGTVSAMQLSEKANVRRATAKVLYITYHFPPSAGVGIPRAISYARNLPRHGFETHIIAPKNPATPLHDPELMKRIPKETTVHRVFNPEPPYALRDRIWKRLSPVRIQQQTGKTGYNPIKSAVRGAIQRVLMPDPQRFWAPFAIRRASQLIREHGIDTILVNTPPYSLTRVVVELKRRFPHVKVIMEVRDDWVGYYLLHFDSAFADWKITQAKRMEREAVTIADYVVAINEPQADLMRVRYPELPTSKFISVANGYDPEQFRDFKPRKRTGGPRMVLGYLGSVYANPIYNPTCFLDALESLPEEICSNIEIRIIGRVAIEAAGLLEGRKARIRNLGFLPQKEAVKQLEECDLLLHLADEKTHHGGKLFDYLATGLPILACTPKDGEVARILRETGAGRTAEAKDVQDIRAMLLQAYESLTGGSAQRIEPRWEIVEQYSWPSLVERLIRLTGMSQ
jgi:glycosyltransferase involved in cell wall biosynthesis